MFDYTAATDAALECLEWSEIEWASDSESENYREDAPENLDGWGYVFSDHARDEMAIEVRDFVEYVGRTGHPDDIDVEIPEQFGHDFILTRNGHGAGFWDRGLGDAGRRLTDAAKTFGEIHAYADHESQTLYLDI